MFKGCGQVPVLEFMIKILQEDGNGEDVDVRIKLDPHHPGWVECMDGLTNHHITTAGVDTVSPSHPGSPVLAPPPHRAMLGHTGRCCATNLDRFEAAECMS